MKPLRLLMLVDDSPCSKSAWLWAVQSLILPRSARPAAAPPQAATVPSSSDAADAAGYDVVRARPRGGRRSRMGAPPSSRYNPRRCRGSITADAVDGGGAVYAAGLSGDR